MATFKRDGLEFTVRDEGPTDGDPVLLLHGFPQDSTAWDAIVPRLHEAGYRTLAPDQRGYSIGAMPQGRQAYRMAELVADCVGLLDAFDIEKAHIVGHDWGGSVAWSMASLAEDRCQDVAVLSTPHPGAFVAVALKSTQLLKSWYMAMFQVPKVSEALLRPGGPGWKKIMQGLPPHQAQHYTQRMSRPGALTAALSWYRALALDMVGKGPGVKRTRIPALYLWGENDPALGRAAAEATADYVTGDYTFHIMSGVGHWVPETAPDVVATELLEFWSSH